MLWSSPFTCMSFPSSSFLDIYTCIVYTHTHARYVCMYVCILLTIRCTLGTVVQSMVLTRSYYKWGTDQLDKKCNCGRFWRLSMPDGENRDHPLANPFGPASPSLNQLELSPVLAMVGGDELLKDRVDDYARRLKSLGKAIEYVEFEGKQHGFFTNDPYSEIGSRVIEIIRQFMLKNSK